MTSLGEDVYVGTLNYKELKPPITITVAETLVNPNTVVVIDAINGIAALNVVEANDVIVNQALTYNLSVLNQNSGLLEEAQLRNGCVYSTTAGGTLNLPLSVSGYHCWFVSGYASGNITLQAQVGETINGNLTFNLQSSKKMHKLIGVGGGLWFID